MALDAPVARLGAAAGEPVEPSGGHRASRIGEPWIAEPSTTHVGRIGRVAARPVCHRCCHLTDYGARHPGKPQRPSGSWGWAVEQLTDPTTPGCYGMPMGILAFSAAKSDATGGVRPLPSSAKPVSDLQLGRPGFTGPTTGALPVDAASLLGPRSV